MSKVVVLKCKEYNKEEIKSLIKRGFSLIEKPDIKGKSVLIKPNLLMPAEPEYAVTTHPVLVEAVGEILLELGAKEILIGDSPGNALSNINNLYKRTGMEDLAERTGFKLVNFSQKGIVEVENPGGVVLVLPITKIVKEVGYVVNLPKLKTHNFTLITCAIKNMFGCLPGFNKSKMHALAPSLREFSRLLVEIFEKIKPDLTIVDAIEGMEGDGPSGGTPKRFDKILMSYDSVSIDAVGGWMLGYKPDEILTTKIAQEKGLGTADLDKIEILESSLEELFGYDVKKVKTIYNILGKVPIPILNFLSHRLVKFIKIFPEINDEKCIRCKICLNSCPKNAISEIDGKMKIDYKKCISCYCCHELCPQHAISIKKNRLAERLWLARD